MIGIWCPVCDSLNVISEIPNEVKCKECTSTFKVNKNEGIYDVHPCFSYQLKHDKLPVSVKERKHKSTEYSWRGTY